MAASTRVGFGVVCFMLVASAAAQEGSSNLERARDVEGTRIVERDGVLFRETTRIERKPAARTEMRQHTRTVYQDRYVTETKNGYRQVYYPVTEVRYHPRWHNLWNPFGQPYLALHPRTTTHWRSRMEQIETPITRRETVPLREVVQVPVRSLYFEDREVVDRVAIAPSRTPSRSRSSSPARPGTSGPIPQVAGQIGGIGRYENEPPRVGTAPIVVGRPIRR